jgi:hypothetical protein
MITRWKYPDTTRYPDGKYWGCWVVVRIDDMRVAVFTDRKRLQHACLECAENGYLFYSCVITFEEELPDDGYIMSVLERVKNEFLTDERLQYYRHLLSVKQGRMVENALIPTKTLQQALEMVYSPTMRERYDNE